MRKTIFIALMALISFMASSQTKVLLKVGGNTMTATLTDNEATRELTKLLGHGDITIRMSDYGGFEKVGALPQSLPTSNTQITTVPGDIMLYQGNQMVVFYGSNSWSYTRLGKIDGATASSLRQFLGNGDITLTLSLESSTGIDNVTADDNKEEIIYDQSGRRITHKPLTPGIYIINGQKRIVKQ
ncbi:MAG: hypothetical protein K2K81_00525 [Muribaculaceae bacterium]|nr:hypothetical protein [Muribaculaceae bacterium]